MENKPKIVRLDGVYTVFNPTFNFPHDYTEYGLTTPAEVDARIADVDILITTRAAINEANATLWAASHSRPKMIAVMAIGTDMLDLAACRKLGIFVSNVPAASNESVAEQAFAHYFAAKRRVVKMHDAVVQDQIWRQTGTALKVFGPLPGTAKTEIMGIIGAGELGNRIATIGRALGMTVTLAERKGVPETEARVGRTSFSTLLAESTVVIMACPLDATTRNMIGTVELRTMRPDALLINVARGGIIVEEDLVQALKEGWIAGAATDVFEVEPAGAINSALVRAAQEHKELNLTLSPHIAWYAKSSIERLQNVVVENIEAFVTGKKLNEVF